MLSRCGLIFQYFFVLKSITFVQGTFSHEHQQRLSARLVSFVRVKVLVLGLEVLCKQ